MRKVLSILLAVLMVMGSITCLFTMGATAETASPTVDAETLPENKIPANKRGEQVLTASEAPALYAVYGSFYSNEFASSSLLPGEFQQFDFDVKVSDDAAGDVKVYMLTVSNGSASSVNYVAGIRNSVTDPTDISVAYAYGNYKGSMTDNRIGYDNSAEWFIEGYTDGSKTGQQWYEERKKKYPDNAIEIGYPTCDAAATVAAGDNYSYSYIFRPTSKWNTQVLVVVEGLTAGSVTVTNPNVMTVSGTAHDDFYYENPDSNYKYAIIGALKEEDGNVFLRIVPNTSTGARLSSKNGGSIYGITINDGVDYRFSAKVRYPAGVAQGTNKAPQFDIFETQYFNYGKVYESAGDTTEYASRGSTTQASYQENGNAYSYNYTANNLGTYVRRPMTGACSTSQYLLADGTVAATRVSNTTQNGRDLVADLKNYGNVWMDYEYKFTGLEETLIESHTRFAKIYPKNVVNLKHNLNETGDGFVLNASATAKAVIYPGYAPEGEVTKVALGMHLYNVMDIDLPKFSEYAPDTFEVLENENGVKGGYIVKSGKEYTAVAYNLATFEGWYDKEGNLVSTDATIISNETGAYYGARFNTENLIKDSGFENYASGTKLYDSAIAKNDPTAVQPWKIHSQTAVEALTAWGSLPVTNAQKLSGSNSLSMNPPWQIVSTPVTLKPNTEYYVSINYAYVTKLPETFLSDLVFGIFAPDASNKNMVSMVNGSVKSVVPGPDFAQNTWAKNGFIFTTGDTVPDEAVFGYLFRVDNPDPDASVSNENNTTLYLDDVIVMPAKTYTVDFEMKNNVAVDPVNGSEHGYTIQGESYSFTLVHDKKFTPVVTANDQVITPDDNGIYTFTPTANTVVKVSLGEDDEGRPNAGKDYKGRDLTAYNPDVYLEKIWEGDTVYQETALFVPGRDTIKLLYPVTEVISLRSYGLETAYIEGLDFEVTADGQIKRLEGSRIPVYGGNLTTTEKPEKNAFPLNDDPNTWLVSIGDKTYPRHAISVTYKHGDPYADGYQPVAPVVQDKALNNFIAKLEKGEEVNIVVYGDSISCGWSSSGINDPVYAADNETLVTSTLDIAPYAPSWIKMVMAKLETLYPGQINYKNLSLGGKHAQWGKDNIAARLALWKDENGNQVTPDLIMIGFGVNDSAGGVLRENFKTYMKEIVDNARTASGNAEMEALFYSAMLPNQLTSSWNKERMLGYEEALCEIADADDNIGVMKLTSIFAEIIKCKDPLDYLNTYWNHGNDFTARMYATGILEAILGDAPTADAPVLEEATHKTVTLKTTDGYEYSLDGVNWQRDGKFTGLKAETEYTFYARIAETNNTYASPASAELKVTTAVAPAFVPGNVDGDEDDKVDLNDVVALAQVVAGWEDVAHNPEALDINGDGNVDLNDVVHLAQYVAGWDVEL